MADVNPPDRDPKTRWANTYIIIEGSLEVKLPTIWTDEKQKWEESEKGREEKKKEDHKREKSQKKEDPGARKGRKVAKTLCFSNDVWLRRVEK